jgi:hypothetical protein
LLDKLDADLEDPDLSFYINRLTGSSPEFPASSYRHRTSSSRARRASSDPVLIAHVGERELRDAVLAVDGPDVGAAVRVGTNLAMTRLAEGAELRLAIPVLATIRSVKP